MVAMFMRGVLHPGKGSLTGSRATMQAKAVLRRGRHAQDVLKTA
jgi:hypothetical protein